MGRTVRRVRIGWLMVAVLAAGPARGQGGDLAAPADPQPRPAEAARGRPVGQAVLLVPLLPLDRDDRQAAGELSEILLHHLAGLPHLVLFRLSDIPPIEETPAALYMAGCPPAEELGCQLVLGEKAGVDRVVSGTLVRLEETSRVSITVLNVALAELEYGFEVELADGEAGALAEALELTLEELADPFDEGEAVDESALRAEERERRRLEKERAAMRALDLALPRAAVETLGEDRQQVRRPAITARDLRDQEEAELIATDWEKVGLGRGQYLRWHNSRLGLDEWRERAANHALQPLVGLSLGTLAGPVALDYDGAWIEDPDSLAVVDSRSTLQPAAGSGFTAQLTLGLGLTPLFDIEVCGSMLMSRMSMELRRYAWDAGDPAAVVFDPPAIDDVRQLTVWGVAARLRLYPVPVWRVKPTVACGFGVMWWPDLANAERYPDFQDGLVYAPAVPYNDQVVVLEPGAVIELGRHLALTADLALAFSVRPPGARTAIVDPYASSSALDGVVDEPLPPSPTYVGFRVGGQIRLLRPRLPSPAREEDVVDDGL